MCLVVHAQIKEAVLQCGTDGEDSLTDEELTGLLQCLPNAEDVQRLRAAPKDLIVGQLGVAEQFMLAMLSIPQVRSIQSPSAAIPSRPLECARPPLSHPQIAWRNLLHLHDCAFTIRACLALQCVAFAACL